MLHVCLCLYRSFTVVGSPWKPIPIVEVTQEKRKCIVEFSGEGEESPISFDVELG